jgi:hypothetical protein
MKFLIITLMVASALCVQSQQIATLEDSTKIEVFDDGTWKPVEIATIEDNSILECSDLIVTETDKMTGKSSISAREVLLITRDGGNEGFGIMIMKVSNFLVFSIKAVGAGSCIDDDDKMNVLFRDGTRLELFTDGKFNCKNNFTLYFGSSFGKKKELGYFKTKEVETMRIWTSDGNVEEDFSSEQSKQLMKTIDCLSK